MDEVLHSYLLIFDISQLNRQSVVDSLDSMPEIVNWMTMFQEAVLVTTSLEVADLHSAIILKFPGQRYLMSTLETGSKQGWLPKTTWDFINHPKPA